jgi:DnaJ-class molecular chaperone
VQRKRAASSGEPTMIYTYYDYLDVAPGASPTRIDVAYAQILNRFGIGSADAGQDLSGLIRQIHAAYDVLSNPEKRQRYDADLERAAREADAELKETLDRKPRCAPRVVQEPSPAMLGAYGSLAA